MEVTRAEFGKTSRDIVMLFRSLETAEDFRKFYKIYFSIIEENMSHEKKTIEVSNKIKGESYNKLRSNLMNLLNDSSDMRSNYAKKIWWFL